MIAKSSRVTVACKLVNDVKSAATCVFMSAIQVHAPVATLFSSSRVTVVEQVFKPSAVMKKKVHRVIRSTAVRNRALPGLVATKFVTRC